MKFENMKYTRPNVDEIVTKTNGLMDSMEVAKDSEEFFSLLEEYYKTIRHFETMETLASIRRTINTLDEFYSKEDEYFSDNIARVIEVNTRKSKVVLNSKFKEEISEKFGKYFLEKAELAEKTFSPIIMDDLSKESKLTTEYEKLLSSAQIDFEGEMRTLAMMAPFQQSKDREMRKKASYATNKWFDEHKDEFDRIYDELVKVRHSMAQKLGYDNFIPLAYMRLGRTDWNMDDAKVYRKQIHSDVVPLAQKYFKEQIERLAIENPKFYDYGLEYNSGNPTPIGNEKELVEKAQTMYSELSKETKEFFDLMVENNLMDLSAKKGKMSGGYCTGISEYKVPFIFSNFNGTSGDVDVLTHEAGHAFQGYCSKDIYPDELQHTTLESAEIHSMSMEFFTHPWMENFFGDDTEKYYHSHVISAIKFLPYGASVDEFQEWVYSNPNASPKERNEIWRTIEKKYQPHIDYDGVEYLENGGRWQRQLHIYTDPFYYLDYTIAQVCAFQFFIRDMENHDEAWNSYFNLCKKGGTSAFTGLIEYAGLENPFKDGTIKKITTKLEKYIDDLDKSKIR